MSELFTYKGNDEHYFIKTKNKHYTGDEVVDLLNEQQELIEELHISDHMGWGRAEKFEKELKQKKIYIKRLEYKVQKFKEENEKLRQSLDHMITKATEINNRNILLHEELGKTQNELRQEQAKTMELQMKIDYLCEKYDYKGEPL